MVAFVCTHNSFRSQVAEALGAKLAGDTFASYSAGTEIAPRINPDAVRLAAELFGIDLAASDQEPKTVFDLPPVDILITMGCGVACPSLPCRYREDWGLDDPSVAAPEAQAAILRDIEQRVLELRGRIQSGLIPQ